MDDDHQTPKWHAWNFTAGLLVFVACCIACGRSESDPNRPKTVSEEALVNPALDIEVSGTTGAKIEAETTESESSTTTGHNSPSMADPVAWLGKAKAIGVAECDGFLKAYRRCLENHGPDPKTVATHVQKLQEQVEAWRTMIAGKPDSAKIIEVGCKAAEASARHATSSWGCAWK